MPRIIVFDVNETLLDLRALDPHFEKAFGDPSARREWFQQLLQSAFVTLVTNAYTDFGSIGGAALAMTAARRGVSLSDEDRERILGAMKKLPPHPDAPRGLARLRDSGLRMVALTNSTLKTAQAQLSHAGLSEYFEEIFSADDVRRLKPAPEPYRMVASRLGGGTGNLRLVAAHAWDVAGALRAGCAAAFVARPGMVLDPLVPTPDVVGKDLEEVAAGILSAEQRAA